MPSDTCQLSSFSPEVRFVQHPSTTFSSGAVDISDEIDQFDLGSFLPMKGRYYVPLTSEADRLIESAWKTIFTNDSKEVASRVRDILVEIRAVLAILERTGADLSEFPAVWASPAEGDGSMVLELPFPEFRIGFGIEHDPDESGWYIFSGETTGCVAASGKLSSGLGKPALSAWLLLYAVFSRLS